MYTMKWNCYAIHRKTEQKNVFVEQFAKSKNIVVLREKGEKAEIWLSPIIKAPYTEVKIKVNTICDCK